jgi:2-polyprenyl-6-methoxyphenol hydroxylase-like FAD-dependent oxidoreductase
MAMTSSSRSRPMNTESRARASSTATPALSELDAARTTPVYLMRIPAGIVNEKMAFVVPEPKRPTGGAFSVYEHDTWIFTVARLAQNEPPGDLATMIRMATQFAPPALLRALKRGEPLGDVAVFRHPGGAWRRYDQMQRFPAGLLVFGDAICSTNPIYGQGMTVAALEATALQECLAEANGDLSQRFFAAAGELIGPLWGVQPVQRSLYGQCGPCAFGLERDAGLPRGGVVCR